MTKQRLDKLLVERGFAPTRTRAQAMILAGQVLIDEQRADKAGQLIDEQAAIRIKGEPQRYVSRGGLKLEAALQYFKIDPANKTCIDIGASTGGFTDCLIQHGAARVWAVEVGHNQLAWEMRQNPQVVVLEGVNARYMKPDDFPTQFDLATVDVSFISLTKVLPAVAAIMKSDAHVIALIKPQFEVGKGEVGRSGVVTDMLKQHRVVEEIAAFAASIGLRPVDLVESPILGGEGNREFLIHLRRTAEIGPVTQEMTCRIAEAALGTVS